MMVEKRGEIVTKLLFQNPTETVRIRQQMWKVENHLCEVTKKQLKTKLRDFVQRANYTDRATAACWRS
jgi:hypothetical protein